ncbi:MAG TPA: DPP IV N-terminal domain-containing protein [Candidatus Ozemobacteraceae bacterium]|nr:DPP IV N-terminal domain-containing protein [Candidatus Ozemobacteraceae bacterium]
MYCSRCGQQLVSRLSKCPACDTPHKLKHRRRRRLLLGLFLFLSGAFVGSLVDGWYFQGGSWGHSMIMPWLKRAPTPTASSTDPANNVPTVHSGNEPLPTVSAVAPPVSFRPPSNKPATGHKTNEPAKPVVVESAKPVASAADKAAAASDSVPAAASAVVVVASSAAVVPPAPAEPASAVSTAATPAIATAASVVVADKPYDLEYKGVETLEEGDSTNYHGSLSGDAPYLLFSSNRQQREGKSVYQSFVRDLSGKAGSVRVFDWPGNVWTPEFARDGAVLVFTSDSQEKEHVFLYDRKTQDFRQLTQGKSKNQMAAMSPDGRFVAFTSDRAGNNDIWMIGSDGQGLIQVTRGAEDEREPRWSPDGRSLYYTKIVERLKTSHIMKIELDPLGQPVEVVGGTVRNWLPDVSPDGAYLAYVQSQNSDGSGNVLRLRRLADGQDQVIKPFPGSEHFRPIWSSDGHKLVFHAERKGRKSLFAAQLQRKPIP